MKLWIQVTSKEYIKIAEFPFTCMNFLSPSLEVYKLPFQGRKEEFGYRVKEPTGIAYRSHKEDFNVFCPVGSIITLD